LLSVCRPCHAIETERGEHQSVTPLVTTTTP
jgi:hypothetical protein